MAGTVGRPQGVVASEDRLAALGGFVLVGVEEVCA